MELENNKLCARCKGYCCQKSGCKYSADDFPIINEETIQKALDNNLASINSCLKFFPDECIFLYLSAREKNKGQIDLVSFSSPCTLLTNTGCSLDLEHRPSGGVYLIPKKNRKCDYFVIFLETIISSWEPYQALLRDLVVKNAHMSFEQRISMEVENLFVEELERKIATDETTQWQMLYPDEYQRALQRYQSRCQNKVDICRNARSLYRKR